MELLSKCDVEKGYKLLHRVLDGVCGRTHPLYADYSQIWSLTDWWLLTEAVSEFCCDAVKENTPNEMVLKRLSGLPLEHQSMVVEVLSTRAEDVRVALVNNTSNISEAALTDFDWKVKLAVASDKLATIKMPLVTMDLDLLSDNTSRLVSVEMNKEELRKLITSLDAANKVVQQLKTTT